MYDLTCYFLAAFAHILRLNVHFIKTSFLTDIINVAAKITVVMLSIANVQTVKKNCTKLHVSFV